MTSNAADSPTEAEPPPGWGKDEITKFLDNARNNQWATFANKRDAVDKLITIDSLFMRAQKDWLNPENHISAILLIRCLASFRAAVGLAMAGQAADTYPQCRSMLEYAAYAAHIYKNPELGVVWLSRHDDATSLDTQRNAFSHRKVLASITAANRHAGERLEKLYTRTIDFGGHPNERTVTGNMQVIEEPGQRFIHAVMQHGDGRALDLALKTVAQCGLSSLEMLQIVFNPRFELLGINARILELRKVGDL